MPASDPLSAWQRGIVWTCCLGGGLARLLYVLVLHPATDHVYSDMQGYVHHALAYFGPVRETIADTIYPPGTSIFLAVMHRADLTWKLAFIAQWLLSLGVMGLIWLIARRMYCTTTAVVALAVSSAYFPFIHYAGLFLSENPFTFCGLLALCLFLLAIDAADAWRAALYSGMAGLAAALAASFKTSILGPLLLLAVVYATFSIKHRWPHLLTIVASAALGGAVLMLPMSLRCTRLSEGHLCPVASNAAMTVLMGHYGETGAFYWHDRARNLEYVFHSPGIVLRGYTERADLDFGAYDSSANLRLAMHWISEHPTQALRLSVLHVYDLFSGRTLWPNALLWGVDWGVVYQWIFWLLILPAAVARIAVRARSMLKLEAQSLPEWLLLAPLLGLMGTVFLTIGEVRYRVPFDGLFIVLAARTYASLGRAVQSSTRGITREPA